MALAPLVYSSDTQAFPPESLWLGESRVPALPTPADVAGGFVDLGGERFYRIAEYDALPPFFVSVVSAFDHWLFVSSTGGLTAGRVDAERALFPYVSVDRVHDAAGVAGAFSCLIVTRGDRASLWEPFVPGGRRAYRLSRHLYKSTMGHRLCFEEVNHDLGLTFRREWTTSDRFGFLSRALVRNDGDAAADVRVVDGLRNIIPAGVPRALQDSMSCLTDAYKLAERVPATSLAVYGLTAAILDQAVAMESLRAAVAWCEGLDTGSVLLTEAQVAAFRRGEIPAAQATARGTRGLYAASGAFSLAPQAEHRWTLAADQGLDQAAVARLAVTLRGGRAAAEADADALAGGERLRAIVGSADGLQSGGDEMAAANHFANVLFNVMRGGVFARGYAIPTGDFARFLAQRSRRAAERHGTWVAGLESSVDVDRLGELVRERGDADLERLYLEYLPLGFSRRHGDPSRPWNKFSIQLRGPNGGERLEYQGNWRDIFQNWEALGTSYPGFIGHMVAKFVNGSTIDGYNAYRVTRAGVEWEEPAPEDPWATIGYWGDHQVVYLLALLEWAERFAPGRFHEWLEREVFAYTAVPYRIADYDAMRRDPRATITFLHETHDAIRAREACEGTDARLVHDGDGRVRHVNLTEKLLLVALVRLANLVPGGGIWMNTQRPEWNDANNALVGFGVSVVTLAQLRRYLVFCRGLLNALDGRPVRLSAAVAEFVRALGVVFSSLAGGEARVAVDPTARRACVDALSAAGSSYRARVYGSGLGEPESVASREIADLLGRALTMVDASLRAARRPDGLFHSYRLLSFAQDGVLPLQDLHLMLEGQVAVLASGLLQPSEAVDVLRALRRSALYREDQHSYLLYPDRDPAGFLQRNTIAETALARSPLLAALLADGDERLVLRDAMGVLRFHADLVNEAALEERLALVGRDERWAEAVAAGADAVRSVYEEVFRHRAFLGRSGTMFAYEGLGSIYWHMVSKLLVAIQVCHATAATTGDPAARALASAYLDVRRGLGFNKSPAVYGAFPSDPYSHTPRHAGAQQPGMTGQAKEGVLARWGELGVHVEDGALRFAPALLRRVEFSREGRTAAWFDARGREQLAALPAGTLAFTFCGTLVVYRLVPTPGRAVEALVTFASGATAGCAGAVLPPTIAATIFARTGEVLRIDVPVSESSCIDILHTHAPERRAPGESC